MVKNEDTLVQEGLDRNEARVVVYLARRKEASEELLAKIIRISVQQCSTLLGRMVRRGILNRKRTERGSQFSLSSFLNELLVKEKSKNGEALRLPPFKLSAINRLIKPSSQ